MSQQNLADELARLRAENDALKAAAVKKLTLKMSDKGCVSLYGINAQFPVSLYPGQWETVFSLQDQIVAYIKANAEELARRGAATKAAKTAAKAA